ncbi:MAG: RiPP maturation radical SAM protein 1 [Pyrinomonadaceae bacterium]|jgi:ribosomal peptide maturation radical SAM protein 1|nr:RiPP maturation radical SAM protein 1 [Pyrinomonadaceae bacterium]
MSDQSVLLINMPWSMPHRPSIQLGTLQSVLRRANLAVDVRSFNLAFMDYIASGDAGLSDAGHFSFDDYRRVAEEYYELGLGDWIFAVAPFRESGELDQRYLEHFRASGAPEEMVGKAVRLRELVPAFLERCANEVQASNPRVVGFTTTFSQNVASLVLAKLLKLRNPSLQVVFGGGNCDGPMGDALHRAFPWVDVVVRGEGERVLPELVRDLLAGGGIRPQPGLCYREGERRVVIAQGEGAEVAMDEIPMPIYDEYFERLQQNAAQAQILPHLSIPFESARGCWWGAKAHCTFCGLNGSAMAFRSKSPGLVVGELVALARKHGRLDFNAVDNIIDMRYFSDFLPQVRDAGYDFKLFYETKANLKKEQLRAMREAGIVLIQPGIESFSTPILKLMKKGVTALQNIRLLKWCAELGIEPGWNVIYGFPGEPPEEYDRMANLVKSLTHLSPPALYTLQLERFSPYHQRPHEYGLEITGPKPYYPLIYPSDEATLNDLAYQFDYRYDDGRKPETYIAALRESLEAWRNDFAAGANLSYRRGPGFLLINDRRPGLGGCNYSLGETEAKIYLSCDGGATPMTVWKTLQADGETEISLEDVADFLQQMMELRLMYEEEGQYLSLAVAANPQAKSAVHETEGALAADPAFVQLSRAS